MDSHQDSTRRVSFGRGGAGNIPPQKPHCPTLRQDTRSAGAAALGARRAPLRASRRRPSCLATSSTCFLKGAKQPRVRRICCRPWGYGLVVLEERDVGGLPKTDGKMTRIIYGDWDWLCCFEHVSRRYDIQFEVVTYILECCDMGSVGGMQCPLWTRTCPSTRPHGVVGEDQALQAVKFEHAFVRIQPPVRCRDMHLEFRASNT
ncbi:hypothetical protein B0T18DRAFT_254952 [Schizothecium vesticola]|uniref:Uncharacterized protein n=1 Tax=Schizothecium vesticola TaxID=314040 RepID=A0AA40BRE2_9PEZI|nr:hypothetical protein B0T18DRAFT_254952 [Schizothecium vesticola]